jgi:amidase
MKRRDFINNTALATAGLSSFFLAACDSNVSVKTSAKTTDVDFSTFSLNEETITGLQEKMKAGTLTSESITQLYLKRIEEIDKAGPTLHSVIELNPDALQIAIDMDNERKSGKIRGAITRHSRIDQRQS